MRDDQYSSQRCTRGKWWSGNSRLSKQWLLSDVCVIRLPSFLPTDPRASAVLLLPAVRPVLPCLLPCPWHGVQPSLSSSRRPRARSVSHLFTQVRNTASSCQFCCEKEHPQFELRFNLFDQRQSSYSLNRLTGEKFKTKMEILFMAGCHTLVTRTKRVHLLRWTLGWAVGSERQWIGVERRDK